MYGETIEHRTSDKDPAHTSMKGTHYWEMTQDERVVLWESELDFSSDLVNFYYRFLRRVSENGEVVRQKTWEETIPRDYQQYG